MGGQQAVYAKYIPGDKKPGESRILRNSVIPEGGELFKQFKGMSTLKEILQTNVKERPDKLFTGTREKKVGANGAVEFGAYQWKTMKQIYDYSEAVANYLIHHDLCPKIDTEDGKFRFCCLYAKNREEWIVSDLACVLTGITVVTLYDTLGKDSIDYILNQTTMKTVFCSADKVKTLLDLKKEGKVANLTHIIYYDEASQNDKDVAQQVGITLVKYEDAINEGKSLKNVVWDEVTADTIYTFSYTSGTTGMPKGVMLSHGNFVANLQGMNKFDNGGMQFYDDDVYISYLPLAHVFERLLMLTCIAYYIQYGFYQGDVMKLREDLAELKPTLMISVPRLFNRFYDVMQAKIKELTGYKRTLCEWGVQKKLYNLEHHGKLTHPFYDALVFKKFKEILGGRVRQMITGSAPISKEVLNFLKIAFCVQINEGYGQTECAAPATITWTSDPSAGHVGVVFPCLEMKLVDVPEMNYTSEDLEDGVNIPRGEVCYRGNSTFKGYFKMADQTKEALDDEGWVHTGDIGKFLPNGNLQIIDRKKNIFKLSQGEYIAPDKIENKIIQIDLVAQAFVYGDSLQNNVVAIIVPDKPTLEKWAAANGVTGTYDEIVRNDKTNKHFLDVIKVKCKECGLFGFEIPPRIHLTSTQFTAENDLLTPTFKLKRNDAKKFFLAEIKNMYDGAKLQGEQ